MGFFVCTKTSELVPMRVLLPIFRLGLGLEYVEL